MELSQVFHAYINRKYHFQRISLFLFFSSIRYPPMTFCIPTQQNNYIWAKKPVLHFLLWAWRVVVWRVIATRRLPVDSIHSPPSSRTSKLACILPTSSAFGQEMPRPMVHCFLPCSAHMAPRSCHNILKQACRCSERG